MVGCTGQCIVSLSGFSVYIIMVCGGLNMKIDKIVDI